jgi:gamma-glutamylcyclotransferase
MLYFAYGSNLCVPRLRHRAPGVRFVECAVLAKHELRWHKKSMDGSGKCSILPVDDEDVVVHGGLFELPAAQKPALDRAEGLGSGYENVYATVTVASGPATAVTYRAARSHVDDSLRPYDWYKELVVRGATALDLPAGYVARLRDVEAWPDPDRERRRDNLAFLAPHAND